MGQRRDEPGAPSFDTLSRENIDHERTFVRIGGMQSVTMPFHRNR
jgi:hypothetical protein